MILVTGATGFVGKEVIAALLKQGEQVRACVRQKTEHLPQNIEIAKTGELSPSFNWSPFLSGVQTIIHLAARVHVMDDSASDPLKEFRNVNTESTLNLAKQAAEAGVQRFVFISSIKVNGEETALGSPYSPESTANPSDPYGISKFEAEEGLLQISKKTNLEVVIIRPPLIYGPGVKANFRAMIKLANLGLPIPLGNIKNKRSLIALDNFVSFILCCAKHPKAKNEVFLISDGEDVSTSELVSALGKALGKPAKLFSLPPVLFLLAGFILNKGNMVQRLKGSLQVDSSKATTLLGWKPTVTMEEALKKTVTAYLEC